MGGRGASHAALIVVLTLLAAGASLALASWSISGSDDARYLGAAVGVMQDYAHWELRWPAYALQSLGLHAFGMTPSGILVGRWLTLAFVIASIAFLAYQISGLRAAIAAILVFSVCPMIVGAIGGGWVGEIEMAWAAIIVSLLFAYLRAESETTRLYVAAGLGLVLGLAVLSRPTAIMFIPIAGLVWLYAKPSWRAAAVVVLAGLLVVAIDMVVVGALVGDPLARWAQLLTVPGGYEAFDTGDILAPPAAIRLTYGLPRVLFDGTPLGNPWWTWLIACFAIIGLGFVSDAAEARRKVGLLLLATIIGILVLLLLPTPRGTFALRLLSRYFLFIAVFLGVAAIVCALIAMKRYAWLRPVMPLVLVATVAFYAIVFIVPQRLYSIPLRAAMTETLQRAKMAGPGERIVTDERTARLMSGLTEIYGWSPVSWIDYETWAQAPFTADAFALLNIDREYVVGPEQARRWLAAREDYAFVEAEDYAHCSKRALLWCAPHMVPVLATRRPGATDAP